MDDKGKKLVRLWLNMSNPNAPLDHFYDLERFCLFVKHVSHLEIEDILHELDISLEEKFENESHRVKISRTAGTYIHFYQTLIGTGSIEKYYQPEAFTKIKL